jgi:hypothetical protein
LKPVVLMILSVNQGFLSVNQGFFHSQLS